MHPPNIELSRENPSKPWIFNTIGSPDYFCLLIPDPAMPHKQIVAPWIKYDLMITQPEIASTFGKNYLITLQGLCPTPINYLCPTLTPSQLEVLDSKAQCGEVIDWILTEHCPKDLLAGVLTYHHYQECYDPPPFFAPSSDPLLIALPRPPLTAKRPLPLNPSPLPELPPLPPSEPSKPSSPIDQPPVLPLIPVPWNIHCRDYSSMEMYQEPPPVENPLEDPDSPMEDAPPLEPEPVTHYEPNVPRGHTKTLSPKESPVTPWEEYLTQPSSPVSQKHSLSPTSPSSAPIRQRTSREGSYQSITPPASSPIAGTLPQSQNYQSTSPGGSADNPSSTQNSADDADSDMALNWVTINTDYLKG